MALSVVFFLLEVVFSMLFTKISKDLLRIKKKLIKKQISYKFNNINSACVFPWVLFIDFIKGQKQSQCICILFIGQHTLLLAKQKSDS